MDNLCCSCCDLQCLILHLKLAHLAVPGVCGDFLEIEALQVGYLVVAIVANEQLRVLALISANVAVIREVWHHSRAVIDVGLGFGLDARLFDDSFL